jgi:hypothetical protein
MRTYYYAVSDRAVRALCFAIASGAAAVGVLWTAATFLGL